MTRSVNHESTVFETWYISGVEVGHYKLAHCIGAKQLGESLQTCVGQELEIEQILFFFCATNLLVLHKLFWPAACSCKYSVYLQLLCVFVRACEPATVYCFNTYRIAYKGRHSYSHVYTYSCC